VGEVDFKEIQPNVWIFEFSKETDKLRVLKGRPWSFDRSLLALTEFDGGIPSSSVEFHVIPFLDPDSRHAFDLHDKIDWE
jgi:hypothetical protein